MASLREQTGLRIAPHITCTSGDRGQVLEKVQEYADAGVRDVVALRGDFPQGSDRFTPVPGGFGDVQELISAISARGDMRVRVSAYPDPHPESRGSAEDLLWLRKKVDAGATSVITQLFFDAETFLRFRDGCSRAGIEVPIIAGVLPIRSWLGAKGFAQKCGVPTPTGLDEAFSGLTAVQERDLGVSLCADLCAKLTAEGADGMHFYTLNRSDMVRDVLGELS